MYILYVRVLCFSFIYFFVNLCVRYLSFKDTKIRSSKLGQANGVVIDIFIINKIKFFKVIQRFVVDKMITDSRL